MFRFSPVQMLRVTGVFATCLACQFGMVGCDSTETIQPIQGPSPDLAAETDANGELVFEYQMTNTARFTIHKQKRGLMMSADGHMDLDEAILPVLESALKEQSVAEAYKKIRSIRPGAFALPKVLLDLDAEFGNKKPIVSSDKPRKAATPDGDADGMDEASTQPTPLAKSAATEPDWDWEADANWFIKQARKFGPKRSGDPNVLWYEKYYTNGRNPYIRRVGYHHFAMGMAASHIATARFTGKEEDCGWFSCDWDDLFDDIIQPRHYRYHSWPNGSWDEVTKEFRITGNQPSPKVHLGVIYYVDFIAL